MPFKDPIKKRESAKLSARKRRLNPEFRKKESSMRKGYNIKRTHGISIETYNVMVQSQMGVCAICGKFPGKKGLCVDHNHSTGQIRSLLCGKCNTALGQINEDEKVAENMILYIKKYKQ